MTEYLKKVKKLVAEKTGHDAAEIDEASYFEDDLNMDKLELVEILTELEDEYQIELLDKKDSIETIQDLLDVLSERLE
jgi:acyl carrier protein